MSDLPKLSDVLARVFKPETEGPFMAEAVVPKFVAEPTTHHVRYDPTARFIAFDVDNGATDIEVRIPYEYLPNLRASIDQVLGDAAVREVGR